VDKGFDEIRHKLADAIRAARADAGLSQEALALAAEVDRTYVSQLERGIANPSLLILYRIAITLNVPIASLLAERR